jgi:FNIP Repeat
MLCSQQDCGPYQTCILCLPVSSPLLLFSFLFFLFLFLRFPFPFLPYFHIRIPRKTVITTISPNNVIVHSKRSIPPSPICLTFSFNFNKPVLHLPSSLVELTFGKNFNQPVDNLPSSITKLIFDESFNHPIDLLPPSLLKLTLGKIQPPN